MLTSRYMTSVKNLPAIMQAIQEGSAPPKFTVAHLKSIGFKSSNDKGVIPLLKDLGFLAGDGTPTKRYLDYRDKSQAKSVLGQALKEAYEDLFHVKEKPSKADRPAIEGKLKATHNVTDRVAQLQAATFFSLLNLADLDAAGQGEKAKPKIGDRMGEGEEASVPPPPAQPPRQEMHSLGLRYNIEIHLPATKDTEVYNAIFKSLKEHLLES